MTTLIVKITPKDTSGEELADWDLERLAEDIDPDGIYEITAKIED